MEFLLQGLLFPIVLWGVMALFVRAREKEELRLKGKTTFLLKTAKGIRIFFLAWMCLMLIAMTAVAFLDFLGDDLKLSALLTAELVLGGFAALGGFGFCHTNYNYTVVSEERIVKVRCFQKNINVEYADMAYMVSYSQGGQMVVYDKDGLILLIADGTMVGVEKLDAILKSKNIPSPPTPFPTEEMKQSPKYRFYQTYSSVKLKKLMFFGFGILALLMAVLTLTQAHYVKFENAEFLGIVEEIKATEKTVSLKLKDDAHQYYINDLIYDALDEDIFQVLEAGKEVVLYVGYTDEYERSCISEIAVDGKTYLYMEETEKIAYDNYKGIMIFGYASLAIGAVMTVLFLWYTVKLIVLEKRCNGEGAL